MVFLFLKASIFSILDYIGKLFTEKHHSKRIWVWCKFIFISSMRIEMSWDQGFGFTLFMLEHFMVHSRCLINIYCINEWISTHIESWECVYWGRGREQSERPWHPNDLLLHICILLNPGLSFLISHIKMLLLIKVLIIIVPLKAAMIFFSWIKT